nr:hypothetical protein [Phycisphaerae bacterium]
MKRTMLSSIVWFLLMGSWSLGAVLKVPSEYPTTQAAIDVSVDGDTVLVAPGTYTGDGNRDIDFGGKAITVRSEAGPGTCIIDTQGAWNNWHRGFYFHKGEQADSVLDGFTITGGYSFQLGGGGIACYDSSPTIRNCVMIGNVAPAGGGLALGVSEAIVSNCIIAGNRVVYTVPSADVGGGVSCAGDGYVILRNCTIYANHALYGGGVRAGLGRWGKISLVNCILFGNRATGSGNQISRAALGVIGPIGVELRNCLIEDDPNAFGAHVDYVMSHMTDCIWGDPLFANPGHWNSEVTPTSWTDGDCHLKSQFPSETTKSTKQPSAASLRSAATQGVKGVALWGTVSLLANSTVPEEQRHGGFYT